MSYATINWDCAWITDSTFLQELFLQRLPPNVCVVLASTSTTTSIEELAALSDKIAKVAAPTIAATSTPSPSPQLLEELQQLRTEVKQLQSSFRSLSLQSRGRSTSRSWQSSPAPHSSSDSSMCWYHQKYGEAAKKCRPPCSYTTLNRQTTWPAVNGEGRVRHSNVSPIAHH